MHYKNEIFKSEEELLSSLNSGCRCDCDCKEHCVCCCRGATDATDATGEDGSVATNAYATFSNLEAIGDTYTDGSPLRYPTTINDSSPDISISADRKTIYLSGGKYGHTYLINHMITGQLSCINGEFHLRKDGVQIDASKILLDHNSKTTNAHHIVEVAAGYTARIDVIFNGSEFKLLSPSRGTTITFVQLS